MRYKGYDWTELAEALGVEIPDCDDPTPLIEYIDNASYWDDGEGVKNPHTKEMRKFLNALCKNCVFYSVPIWKGLKQIKNDETFIKYFLHLLPFMWS